MLRSPLDSRGEMQGGPPRLEDSKRGEGHEVKSVVERQEQISCRALSLDTWPAVETLKKKKKRGPVQYCLREVSVMTDTF